MSASILEAVRLLVHNKGISEELILQTVEEILTVAYKKQFGNSDNAVTKINEETGEVHLYSKKEVVETVGDKLFEISLEEAKKSNESCELGDEVLVEINLSDLGRIAAQVSRQVVFQRLRDIEKNVIYSEYKQKIGQLITGVCQRQRNRHIFVDLGRTEAILPAHEQSPKELFEVGERIKAVIVDVRDNKEAQVVLSRSSPIFVQRLFELDVPEINEGVIEIKAIVREPSFRTKIAVYSKDIDPVGPCVGMKGMRIQNIVKELEGEKIDIIRYKDDIKEYITHALSPAKIEQVIIINESRKEALAVVGESQLSLSIGKQGHNVKLASKLTGWNIDIKSTEEFAEAGFEDESRRAAESLFISDEEEYVIETHPIEELEALEPHIISILKEQAGIDTLEKLVEKTEEDLSKIDGIDKEQADAILKIIADNIVIVDDDKIDEKPTEENEKSDEEGVVEDVEDKDVYDEEVTYYCPECNTEIAEDAKECPSCGVGIEFE